MMCSLLRRKRERGSSQGQSNERGGACRLCLAIVRVWEKVLNTGLWHAGRLAIISLRFERSESLALRCMKGAVFKISQAGFAGEVGIRTEELGFLAFDGVTRIIADAVRRSGRHAGIWDARLGQVCCCSHSPEGHEQKCLIHEIEFRQGNKWSSSTACCASQDSVGMDQEQGRDDSLH